MNQTALGWIDSRTKFGMRPGIDRIRGLTDAMGRPQDAVRSIGVAGTNGKFSVVMMCEAILQGFGLTVGSYTSPHLHDPAERFRLAGEPVPGPLLERNAATLRLHVELYEESGGEPLTWFELATALAIETFFDRAPHVAIYEAGLGGLYDATNVCDSEVAVITSIGNDHLAQFGDVHRAIGEKSGIVKPGSVAVLGSLEPQLAAELEAAVLAREPAEIRVAGRDFRVSERFPAVGGQAVSVETHEGRYPDIFLPVFGEHQASNLAVAIATAEAFVGHELDPEVVSAGLESLVLPGRAEVIARNPLVVVDTAHNAQAMEMFLSTVAADLAATRPHVVWGSFADKPLDEIAAVLSARASVVTVCTLDSDRAANADVLRDALDAAEFPATGIQVIADPVAAVRAAQASTNPDGCVAVAGSFLIVESVREAYEAPMPVPVALDTWKAHSY